MQAVLMMLITSCIKEEFEPDLIDTSVHLSPAVAAPIGYVHYQLEELIRDSVLGNRFTIDNDGFITMSYEEEIASVDGSDLFIFSDIDYTASIFNSTGLTIILDTITGSLDIQDTIRIPFNIPAAPDAEVDSIILRGQSEISYADPDWRERNDQVYGDFLRSRPVPKLR